MKFSTPPHSDPTVPAIKKTLAGAATAGIAATGAAIIALSAGSGHGQDRQAHPRANHIQAASDIWMPSATPKIWMP